MKDSCTGKRKGRFFKAALVLSLIPSFFAAYSQERVSPFERASQPKVVPVKPVQTAPSQLDKVEFTGLLAFGGNVTISLYDTVSKQSIWVPLDGDQDGYSVSGFDEENGTISVTLQGQTRQIAINENEIVAIKRNEPAVASRATAPVPKKPVRVKDPQTIQKEEEARLFVSDLLANGMVQREKYRQEREARIAKAKGN